MKNLVSTTAALLLTLMSLDASAQPIAAAEVNLVTGVATASSGGVERDLSRGASVYSGEVLATGANSYLNLRFRDGGRIVLRPDTRFTVETFEYSGPPAPEAAPAPAAAPAATAPVAPQAQAAPVVGKSLFSLVRGGFRAISGLLGKSSAAEYRVSTPIATIGVRGTDYEVIYCQGDCPTEMLPPGTPAESGIVVGVNEGGVRVTTSAGTFDVDVKQFGFAAANGKFYVLPFQPMSLMINPTPSPDSCQ